MKNSFVTGVIMGAMVGAAVGIAVDPIRDRQRRSIKHKTTRAFRTIGHVIDSIL